MTKWHLDFYSLRMLRPDLDFCSKNIHIALALIKKYSTENDDDAVAWNSIALAFV